MKSHGNSDREHSVAKQFTLRSNRRVAAIIKHHCRGYFFLFAFSLGTSPGLVKSEAPISPDVIAVSPTALQPSLSDWIARRSSEGLSVAVVEPGESLAVTLTKLNQLGRVGKTRYVLLLGDSQTDQESKPLYPEAFIPTGLARAEASAAWQHSSLIPTDYLYGDLNNDGKADAAVGRLPVHSQEQARDLFHRIASYEDSHDFGPWRTRVELVAGLGGFGTLVDKAIETVATGIITGSLPKSVVPRVTHAGPSSPFCPGNDLFTETVINNYREGSRFWVYAGHGSIQELDKIPPNRDGRPILSANDLPELKCSASSAPIALILACYTGAIDAEQSCFAKQMLLSDGGPVAVLAGTRVTMPYGNTAAAIALIHAVYETKAPRLGDVWLRSLEELSTPTNNSSDLMKRRGPIDGLASILGSASIDEERREHGLLYNWLGDPTMRLNHPSFIQLKSGDQAQAGSDMLVSADLPTHGLLKLSFHRRLGAPELNESLSVKSTMRINASQRYKVANKTELHSEIYTITAAGPWHARVSLPNYLSGPVTIIATISDSSTFATGAKQIWVRNNTEIHR
jgi:hypothetical protein